MSDPIQELGGRARASILIVDDDPDMCEFLADRLANDGYEVEIALSGEDAVEALERRSFDLAITDLCMPGMNGIETLEALLAIDPGLEVIVATGYASIDTAVACMKRGAYDYLQKPYDLATLRVLVDRATRKGRIESMLELFEASRAMLSTLELEDLLPNALTLSQRVLAADGVALALSAGDSLVLHRALELDALSDGFASELAHAAWTKGEALSLPSPYKPEWRERLAREGCAFALAYPLQTRERRAGVLIVVRDERSPAFSSAERRKGTVLANQLALSIENARLYAELHAKMRELVRAQNELVQAERFAMAGHIAGCVAHEVNNALAVIGANADALHDYEPLLAALWDNTNEAAEHIDAQPTARAQAFAQRLREGAGDRGHTERLIADLANLIDETQTGVARISDLVAGFIRLSHPSEAAPPERIPLGDLIQECVRTLPERARGEISIGPMPRGFASVSFMSREDLRTSLATLLEYASAPEHARTDGEGIEVRVETRERRPCIVISAPGIAMSAEERRRLFDPQLRVETQNGRAMRLDVGLALTYAALARNRAEVSVADGTGLTIYLLLPAGPIAVV